MDMLPPALMETACKDMARVDFQIDLSSESVKKIVQSLGSLRAIQDVCCVSTLPCIYVLNF
jgi:ACT domain-containing protein